MGANATLCHHNTREWLRFWFDLSPTLGSLVAYWDEHVAHIFDRGELVAEFTPENTREFILSVIAEINGG